MTVKQAVIELEQVNRSYRKDAEEVRALVDVTVRVEAGEFVAVVGPSGSGKSTLLNVLGLLDRPDSGTFRLDGGDVASFTADELARLRNEKIGFVFQTFHLLPKTTALENVELPLIYCSRADISGLGARALEQVGLADREKHLPGELSGGEQQRVAIARALVNEPELILADEPTGNLDSQTGQEVMMILWEITRDAGCAVVLVTHDRRVEEISDRVLWLEDGSLRDRKAEPHAWVRDPVCGMRIDEWTARHATELDGVKYVFCSEGCLERFEAAPDRYRSCQPE